MNQAKRPERVTLEGAYVRLAPLNAAAHGDDLWEGTGGAANESLWRYMHDGPFFDRDAFQLHLERKAVSEDPFLFAIVDPGSGRAVGLAALMRIKPAHRVIEVGNIMFSPGLQRT